MIYLFIQTGTIIPNSVREQMLGLCWASVLNKMLIYLVFMLKMLLYPIKSGHKMVPTQAL
jgi:hypothetical protein